MKRTKRLAVWSLFIVMLASILPVSVWAEQSPAQEQKIAKLVSGNEVVYYTDLDTALSASESGDVITLLGDCSIDLDLDADSSLTLPVGVKMIIPENITLSLVHSQFKGDACFYINGILENNGRYETSRVKTSVEGVLNNNATIYILNSYGLVVYYEGQIINKGIIDAEDGDDIEINCDTFINYGTIKGYFYIWCDTFNNYGEMITESGGTIYIAAIEFVNNGVITAGELDIRDGFINNGVINATDSFSTSDVSINNGVINVGYSIENHGNFTNNGLCVVRYIYQELGGTVCDNHMLENDGCENCGFVCGETIDHIFVGESKTCYVCKAKKPESIIFTDNGVIANDFKEDCVLIIATYKDEAFVDCEIIDVTKETSVEHIFSELTDLEKSVYKVDTIKAFVLKDLESLTPLCVSDSIKITQ